MNQQRTRLIAGIVCLCTMLSRISAGPQDNAQSDSSGQGPAGPSADGQEANQDPGAPELTPNPPGDALGLLKRIQHGSSSGIAKGDFNGDGFADLAIGVPGKTVSGISSAGAVIVIYGSANGLVAPAAGSTIPQIQFWSLNAAGVPDGAAFADGFSVAMASGDFNGDGFSDLAIGAPNKKTVLNGLACEGTVTIIYGSQHGLTTDPTLRVLPPQEWRLPQLNETSGLFFIGAATTADFTGGICQFGQALAWGDFNGDGIADLAIGAPRQQLDFGLNGTPHVGVVGILYGGRTGLQTLGSQIIRPPFSGGFFDPLAPFPTSDGNEFGAALTSGSFHGNGFSDLAVGIPGQNIVNPGFLSLPVTTSSAGIVEIFDGSFAGLGEAYNRLLYADPGCNSGITFEAGDRFGMALAAGDFDGNGRADLAVGIPFKRFGTAQLAGRVFVYYNGQDCRTDGVPPQTWSQSEIFGTTAPLQDTVSEPNDNFGWSLAAGDFNADGKADLAIGVPFEDYLVQQGTSLVSVADAGEVDVLYGSSAGLSIVAHAPQAWHQDSPGIGGTPQKGDAFGFSLTAWNFGHNETVFINNGLIFFPETIRTADLAVGVPFKVVSGILDAGAVHVLYGSSAGHGLTSSNHQVWTENSSGMPTQAQTGDHFGLTEY